MNKKQLLKEHPELVREVLKELFNKWVDGPIEDTYNNYLKEQNKPKTYNILELFGDNNKDVTTSWKEEPESMKRIYHNDEDHYHECFLRSTRWKIYKIQRISDGEIFTVGDRLQDDPLIEGPVYIKEFEINEGWCDGVRVITAPKWASALSIIEKYKKPEPLFITEDGVEIYNEDTMVYVSTVSFTKYGYPFKWLTVPTSPYIKVFSSEKARDEYIFRHKPSLSLHDIEEKMHESDVYVGDLLRKLQILLKSKQLNNNA